MLTIEFADKYILALSITCAITMALKVWANILRLKLKKYEKLEREIREQQKG